ncbi:TIGR04222 domain-containing membrane protein [uncultured Erythrobacter sp.]|uniref:TIGR04222 domain-containing membrane protein n=1 Tax=uncultured Erythrobacter sp. TaxID=263913 RepID=UPI00262F9FF2|nr:TIGR04222 domain-containing membrane protein [uncultured Erythrobacter sp.]
MQIFSSYTGFDFVAFYLVMLITSIFASIWMPAVLRRDGRPDEPKGMEETAFLSGGKVRHTTAILTDLFAQGAFEEEKRGKLRVVRKNFEVGEAGRAVLAEIGALRFSHFKSTLHNYARRVEAQLTERGLLLDQGQRFELRVLSILPYIALVVLGLYRVQAGSALGEPTGFLVALLLATAVFALVRFYKFNPRTRAGNEALKVLEERSSRLRRAPAASEVGFAVALFGTGVLVGTPWEPVHAMTQLQSGGNGGSGSNDGGCGGGGCGGGGCGGCGG